MDKTNAERQARYRQSLKDQGWKVTTSLLCPAALEKLKDSPLTQTDYINRAILAYEGETK